MRVLDDQEMCADDLTVIPGRSHDDQVLSKIHLMLLIINYWYFISNYEDACERCVDDQISNFS